MPSELLTDPYILGGGLFGGASLASWYVKNKFSKVEELENRVVALETKIDILGDIKDALYHVRTDVELIKARLERDYDDNRYNRNNGSD